MAQVPCWTQVSEKNIFYFFFFNHHGTFHIYCHSMLSCSQFKRCLIRCVAPGETGDQQDGPTSADSSSPSTSMHTGLPDPQLKNFCLTGLFWDFILLAGFSGGWCVAFYTGCSVVGNITLTQSRVINGDTSGSRAEQEVHSKLWTAWLQPVQIKPVALIQYWNNIVLERGTLILILMCLFKVQKLSLVYTSKLLKIKGNELLIHRADACSFEIYNHN